MTPKDEAEIRRQVRAEALEEVLQIARQYGPREGEVVQQIQALKDGKGKA